MAFLLAALVRIVALGAGLAAYYALVPVLFPGDDGLGAGLIGFALLVLTAFVWSVVDGRRRGVPVALGLWAVVAVVVSVVWAIGLALVDGEGTPLGERIASELSSAPFIIGLLLVPAAVGAAIGAASRRS